MKPSVTHIALWGMTRSGKSTRLKAILRERRRFVVFDLMGEHADIAPTRADTLAAVLAAIKRGWSTDFRVRYVPPKDADPAAALDGLSKLMRDVQQPYMEDRDRRQVTLAVDELAASFPNVQSHRSAFAALCQRGSHFGINLIGTSQRPATVSTTFRGNALVTYWFTLAEHVDVDAAAKSLGPARAARLRTFEPHRYFRVAGQSVTEGKNSL